jgi:subtilisin family serine protease
LLPPGNEVWSTTNNGSYGYMSGTSMAAPLVAGGLAIIKQEFSSLTNAQVVDRLFATATDSGEYSQTTLYGHGMMNLNAATTAVANLQTINGSNLIG